MSTEAHPGSLPRSGPGRESAGASQFLWFTCALLVSCGGDADVRRGESDAAAPTTELVPHSDLAPAYVGSDACGSCHTTEFERWRSSHHFHALEDPTQKSVRGAFDGREVMGVHFERHDGDFVIRDRDESFTVRHTFGVEPLQQYLVSVGAGRLQAFDLAWDTERERWFPLQSPRPQAGDVLHWQGLGYNWNTACADCHSTGIRKGLDAASGEFDTQWIEPTVGCEACHGPGAPHVADPSAAWSQHLASSRAQVDTCAPCHSRRAQIAEGHVAGDPLLDHYLPALLTPPEYQADGQIEDEVYVYGSYLQSAMHAAGVRCGDCHDPHAARVVLEGDGLCLQCHSEQPPTRFPMLRAADYDTPAHHFHAPDAEGARCVSCHMPERIYMVVDGRRDHSFRIPDPWLAGDHGLRDACTACHEDQDAAWAAGVLEQRGVEPPSHHGRVLAELASGNLATEQRVAALAADASAPALVRATALAGLGTFERGYARDAIESSLNDPEPLVRLGALQGAERIARSSRWRRLVPGLSDPVRGVRQAAFLALLPRSRELAASDAFEAAMQEYVASQELHADLPASHTNLASMHLQLGDAAQAEDRLERALELEPRWVPALLNLADLYRDTGRDEQGGDLLRGALAAEPESAAARFALGLWSIRNGARSEALRHLLDAASLAPTDRRFAYVAAVAVSDTGDFTRAIEMLEAAAVRLGKDREMGMALVSWHLRTGDLPAARSEADALAEAWPMDPEIDAVRRRLRAGP